MKFKLALFLFSISFYQSAFGMDVGDGSDGTCAVTGPATTLITLARRNYQCTTLDIDGNLAIFKGVGGAAVIIKVQGNVTMMNAAHTLDISGADGLDGGVAVDGGLAGAGGNSGGNSQLPTLNGFSGNGTGGGIPGKYVAPFNIDSIGGGGGGGRYNNNVPTEPTDGDDSGGGSGGGTGSKGANGISFGSEATFETTFVGGSGGGAGGGGKNGGVPITGSSGGGGGGALRIIAGGNITIAGTIRSNGGKGGGIISTPRSGGGGGGSGGAIWLQAAGNITGTGTIEALGGAMGTNADFAGFGGDGSFGRIRLDDSDGVVALGSVSPVAYNTTFTPTAISSGSNAISRQYASAIACGRVSIEHEMPWNNLINLLLGMMIASAIYFSISRKGKI